MRSFLSGLVLAAALIPAGAAACTNCTVVQVFPQQGGAFYPPGVYAPQPYFYPPPAFYMGSGWDPDYRDIRYNRYFQRYQDAPQIRGFTLR